MRKEVDGIIESERKQGKVSQKIRYQKCSVFSWLSECVTIFMKLFYMFEITFVEYSVYLILDNKSCMEKRNLFKEDSEKFL